MTTVIIAPLNSQKFSLSGNIYLTENSKQESKGQTKTGKLSKSCLSFISETQLSFLFMARPRLYNTPEEKKAARAAISRQSYQRCVIDCVSVEKFS